MSIGTGGATTVLLLREHGHPNVAGGLDAECVRLPLLRIPSESGVLRGRGGITVVLFDIDYLPADLNVAVDGDVSEELVLRNRKVEIKDQRSRPLTNSKCCKTTW